ncbi:hypothetical protein BDE02_15G103300 [Populus trichocarpa]|nr:hypothetical protein BDE02_15G103300 [Populus trichocarpa]
MSHHNTYQSQEAYPPPSQQAPPQYSDPPPSQQAHPPQGYHQGPYVAPPAAEKKRHKWYWRCCVYSCCKRLYCWRCCLDCCCECSPVFVLMSVIHHYSNHISGNPCGKLT